MLEVIEVVLGADEYEQALNLRKDVFVKEQNVPEHLEIEYEEDSIHFLGRLSDSKEPVCVGRLRPLLNNNILKFERIATLSPYRGRGYAATLMGFMQDYAKQNFSHLTWKMNAQVSAVAFYEKLGWRKVDNQIFWDAGIGHYSLSYDFGYQT